MTMMYSESNEIVQNDLKKLNAFCSMLGKDPLLVQGAGGNVSFKNDDVLWIKASGTQIFDALERNIFVPVNLKKLHIELEKGNFAASPQTLGDIDLRPSIETLLHALLPYKFVFHLHAIEPLAHLVRDGVRDQLPCLMGFLSNWICVDYFKPGADLANAIAKELKSCPNAEIIFMINHGIVVGADSIEGISKTLDHVIKLTTIEPYFHEDAALPPADEKLTELRYRPCIDRGINQLAQNDSMFRKLKTSWALYPDHLVFLGAYPAILGVTLSLCELFKLDKKPSYIFVPRIGVYEHETVTAAQHAQLRCYFDVLSRQHESQDLVTLNEKEVEDILNWDSEHYRQNQILGANAQKI